MNQDQNKLQHEEFLDPANILKSIPLKDDMIACDFGCGSGGWALPLCNILTNGLVYAIDILPESISALRGKAGRQNIFNISPMLADVEKGVKIEDKQIDLALLTNILFQIKDKEGLIKECRRVLKSRGWLLIVDYKKDAAFGPNADDRLSPEDILPMLDKLGFREEKRIEAGKYHWAILLNK
jgi:ubiquinone/menaquinone biosynthesis C-methylase UbiE